MENENISNKEIVDKTEDKIKDKTEDTSNKETEDKIKDNAYVIDKKEFNSFFKKIGIRANLNEQKKELLRFHISELEKNLVKAKKRLKNLETK